MQLELQHIKILTYQLALITPEHVAFCQFKPRLFSPKTLNIFVDCFPSLRGMEVHFNEQSSTVRNLFGSSCDQNFQIEWRQVETNFFFYEKTTIIIKQFHNYIMYVDIVKSDKGSVRLTQQIEMKLVWFDRMYPNLALGLLDLEEQLDVFYSVSFNKGPAVKWPI